MASSSQNAQPKPAEHLLPSSSFTAHRLRHSTPIHMHLTSRTLFIGPIPRGWTQRKDDGKDQFLWDIKERTGLSSRTLTFSAEGSVGRTRRVSGLEVQQTNEGGRDNNESAVIELGSHEHTVISESSTKEPERQSRSRTRKLAPEAAQGLKIISPVPEGVVEETNEENGAEENGAKEDGAKEDGAEEETHLGIPPGLKRSSPTTAGAEVVRDASVKTSLSAERQGLSTQCSNGISGASTQSPLVGPSDSTTKLIAVGKSPKPPSVSVLPPPEAEVEPEGEVDPGPKGILDKITHHRSRSVGSQNLGQSAVERVESLMPRLKSHIRFDLTNQANRSALVMRAQMAQAELGSRVRSLFHAGEVKQGEILKMERMLVREDITSQKKLPHDFDENTSQGIVSSTLKKWREFMIVCRRSEKIEGARYVLQAYKTRAIPALEDKVKVLPELEIPIDRKMMDFNLYSSLDKTLVFWISDVQKTHIYILQSHSAANSVEWFTLIRALMGYERPTELTITVPDINVSLRLDDPFSVLQLNEEADEEDETALLDSLAKEEHVADSIIERCVNMLSKSQEWAEILREWSNHHRIGLAWKRYDRLEWVCGANEMKMFGTIAMTRTHELELRPKEHYPTKATTKKGKVLTEPPPVEGFLILRTLQNGTHHRLGRNYSRRLYFATFDHYLVFTRPRSARPPPPPKARTNNTSKNEIPIVYAVTPYPIVDERIDWLNEAHAKEIKDRDHFATEEARRRYHILSNAEGFIDLSEVVKVRKLKKKSSEVTIMPEEMSSEDEELEAEIADSKSFEMIMRNGLTVRLQAYDDEMRKEWRDRLRALVMYWRWRHRMDIGLYRQVRDENLEELQIDEEGEAWVGQFARKWELTQTYASPEMYNVCGLSFCRTIHIAGPLYRKPRMRGNFTLVHCILVPGALLVYQNVLRKRTGKVIPHVLHEREQKMSLEGCYLYSGLLTENDLLYRNRTFDANAPGHHALPRIWPEDGWNNFDEDVMTCFVLWRPSGKSWFRDDGSESGHRRLKRVNALGKTGNRMVFRARSRAERDQWVLAIGAEIERLQSQGKEDVRIVESKS